MKKYLALLLALTLVLLLSACGGDSSLSGSGTESDPYRIGTAEELWQMAALINSKESYDTYGAAHYVLTADIDLGGKKEWTPIGIYNVGFEGVLDGAGHTVSGIKINYSDPLVGEKSTQFALIGRLSKGAVRNLTVSNSTITTKGENSVSAAAVVADLFQGTVENCHTTDSVSVTSSFRAGGIIGKVNTEEPIRDCTNAASVTALSNVSLAGGITTNADCRFLSCSNSGTITSEGDAAGIVATVGDSVMDCTNSGTVSAVGQAGGIVVTFDDGALNSRENDATVTLVRCVNTGAVSSAKKAAGGIAAGARTGSVVDCTNRGTVVSGKEAGGIIAYFHISGFGTAAEEFTVSGCINIGDVTAKDMNGNSEAGGILGKVYSGKTRIRVTDCTNSGLIWSDGLKDVVDTSGEAGGILGSGISTEFLFENCTNTGEIRGVTEAGGIAGKVQPNNQDGAVSSFRAVNCSNSGSVLAAYRGGLATMCYSGGIVGYMAQEEDPSGVFASADFEGCSNSGELLSDIQPFCADDICASDRAEENFALFD